MFSLKKSVNLANILLVSFSAMISAQAIADDNELVIYSSRKAHLIDPLIEAYSKETGVNVKVTTGKAAALLARLQSEGEATPADIFITVDGGNLWNASARGILLPLESEVLTQSIPSQYRSTKNDWFGLSLRLRTIFYSTERVKAEELSSYEDLASEKWKGRLCLRTSQKVYNQSLVATMIENFGQEKTTEIVTGWVNNLAAPVFSSDSKMLDAIDSGQCDLAIANTYYYGRKIQANPDYKVGLFWANQQSTGTHANVSGAAVVKHSKNAKAAQALIEWLAQGEAQELFANLNKEVPANPGIEASDEVKAWGAFKADNINVETTGQLQLEAVKLMDNAQYR